MFTADVFGCLGRLSLDVSKGHRKFSHVFRFVSSSSGKWNRYPGGRSWRRGAEIDLLGKCCNMMHTYASLAEGMYVMLVKNGEQKQSTIATSFEF